MGSNNDNIDLLKQLLPGLSVPVSSGLADLILNPSISISPYFYPILFGGFATFIVSLGSAVAKKLGWKACFWHILGTGIAGFVVVSWARYQSIFVSVFAEVLILVSIGIALFMRREKIAKYYKRYFPMVLSGLIIAGLLPVATIVQNIDQPPVLVVSPSNQFVIFTEPHNLTNAQAMDQDVNVNIAGVYADIYNVKLTAEPSNPLFATYLDNKENGPVEIPFLERGQNQNATLRIEISPQLQSGTYMIALNYSYLDGLGRTYQGSNSVSVFVGNISTSTGGIATYAWIALVAIVTTVLMATIILIRRRRTRGEKPQSSAKED